MPCRPRNLFRQLQEQGVDFLLTPRANQKTLQRHIRNQFHRMRRIPFVAKDHEIRHGRDITCTLRKRQAPEHIRESWVGTSWIMEVADSSTSDSKPFQVTHLF